MPTQTLTIVHGPDKPALQWALAYPEREQVHFQLQSDGIDAQIVRMDELSDGFSFSIDGIVKSGEKTGASFHASYSVETRSGSLSIEEG
jgi:hypothetical protein